MVCLWVWYIILNRGCSSRFALDALLTLFTLWTTCEVIRFLAIAIPIAVFADCPCGTRLARLALDALSALGTVFTVSEVERLSIAQCDGDTCLRLSHVGDDRTTLDELFNLGNLVRIGLYLLLQAVDVIVVVLTGSYCTCRAHCEQADEQVTENLLFVHTIKRLIKHLKINFLLVFLRLGHVPLRYQSALPWGSSARKQGREPCMVLRISPWGDFENHPSCRGRFYAGP